MNKIKKILIVRFSSLGDVVLATPVFTHIKQALPQAEVVFLTKARYASFFVGHPSIDRVIQLGSSRSFLQIISMIRKEDFDVMIDLHRNIRSYIVSWFGGFKTIIRYRSDFLARRMLVMFRKNSPRLQIHTIDKYLETLVRIGITPKAREWQLFPGITMPIAMEGKKPSIVVMQTAFIGDLVLTVPLLESIKKNISCRLTVFTTPQGAEIFKASPAVDNVIVFDKKGADRGIWSLFKAVGKLRSCRADIALIPHRSFKTALIAFLARIPHRVGFSNSGGSALLNHVIPFNWHEHDIKRNLSLLFPLGIKQKSVEWNLQIHDDAHGFADEMIRNNGLDKKPFIIGINPGSIWPTKRWLPDRFAQVADYCAVKYNAGVIIFGGAADADSAEKVVSSAQCSPVNMCGRTSLQQLHALVGRCSLFITNDSGPMHIAVAMKVPTIALFGPTTREMGFFPYGEQHRVLEVSLECRPCGLHGGKQCPKKHFNCMRKITVNDVCGVVDDSLTAVTRTPGHHVTSNGKNIKKLA